MIEQIEMKPDYLNESLNVASISPMELYAMIESASTRHLSLSAVKHHHGSDILTYGQLIINATILSKNIPFDNHPIEINMKPSMGAITAIVACLKKGCKPVGNDRDSKIKLIINDNMIKVPAEPVKKDFFNKYIINKVTSTRPEMEFYHSRQLKKQEFIDKIISVLIQHGVIIVKNE